MGSINSIITNRDLRKLQRYVGRCKWTKHTGILNKCICYDPNIFEDSGGLEQSPKNLLTIEKIVDAKKEKGLKRLLKAMEKCCICIRSVPMIRAIHTGNLESLQFLLDNGGERNPVISAEAGVEYCFSCILFCTDLKGPGEKKLNFVPLWVRHWTHGRTTNGPEILKCMVNAQSNVNINLHGSDISVCFDTSINILVRMKLFVGSDLLDVLFHNGCKLDKLPTALGSALLSPLGHVNYIIWLVRHGMFTSAIYSNKTTYRASIAYAIKIDKQYPIEILLHAGTRWEPQAYCALYRNCSGGHKTGLQILDLPDESQSPISFEDVEAFETSHLDQRVSDLQEFSDESINIYPEPHLMTNGQCFQRIIDFLSQPVPLKWLCRRKLRQSMVSHCPSAVNSLPLPKPLKRYIMCHGVYW